jgi:tRNA modification GTPase
LAIFFPAPHSYTGEDVLELQAHGGPVVLQMLLARCLQAAAELDAATHAPLLAHLRVAQPGEFTERAFLNGKLDLAQAEAVADLIDASTEAAAKSAARSLSGEFSREVARLRDALIHLRMLVEATLDFPEEDIDFLTKADARGQLQKIEQQLQTVMRRATQGALLREGIQVVIAGQPNAGKSSLLNALAGAELAIVTPIAGTTRDKVSETIQIEGVPLHIVDTAGLRADHEASDEVERIGIARAWAEIERADVLLHVHDWAAEQQPGDATKIRAARADISEAIDKKVPPQVPRVQVWNKIDITNMPLAGIEYARAAIKNVAKHNATKPADVPDSTADNAATSVANSTASRAAERIAAYTSEHTAGSAVSSAQSHASRGEHHIALSAKTGAGLDALRAKLLELAGWRAAPEGVYIARERHVQALRACEAQLHDAQTQLTQPQPALDLCAESLRLAQNALSEITGEFTSDDLLGVIFSTFCIGK